MTSPLSNYGRSSTSFQIEVTVSKGLIINNITFETTTQVGETLVKLDQFDDQESSRRLLAHFDKGMFSNLGSWSMPFSWNGEFEVTQDGIIRASILNESGENIYCTLTVNPKEKRS